LTVPRKGHRRERCALPNNSRTPSASGTRAHDDYRAKGFTLTTTIDIPAIDAFLTDAQERGRVETSELEALALELDLDEPALDEVRAALTTPTRRTRLPLPRRPLGPPTPRRS
jgi:hypothetical protein